MLYHILYPLHETISGFNVFRYITVRGFLAFFSALTFYFLLHRQWIGFLKSKQFGQTIRTDGPESHQKKKNTPTMGGVLVLGCALASSLLWVKWNNPLVWACLFSMVTFGLIGAYDDFLKVIRKDPNGFRGQYKIVLEFLICLAVGLFLYGTGHLSTNLSLPFLKTETLALGPLYLYFAVFVITGTANAVNLTDGLDGLVTVPSISSFLSFGVLCYAAGNLIISGYLQMPFVSGAGEVTILCMAMMGALAGFLWDNTHPAEIFMGDVGSLGIGGLLGTVALVSKNELLLLLIGGIFVLETVSVITQVASFKLTGKRIFRMAPIHHHFELKGWSETKVTVRFWLISFLLSLLALATLKIR